MTFRNLNDTRLAVVASWVGYAALFLPLHALLNDVGAFFLLVPAMCTAWAYGMRGAVAAIAVMWPLQGILFLGADHDLGLDMYVGYEGLVVMGGFTVLVLLAGLASRKVVGLTRLHTAKDRMVASVSHEVRNPLAGVLGMAELLDSDWDDILPSDRHELVATIANQAREAASIIEDLLIVARMGSGVELSVYPESVDLATLAGTTAAHAPGAFMVATETAVAYADPARARQIVTNLISNATKYGGPTREIATGSGGGLVWLEVRDDGDGVDPDVLGGLFEPFSAGDHREATGIGLAVSRALAHAMRGDLTYRRQAGLTVFRLSLPAASTKAQVDALRTGTASVE